MSINNFAPAEGFDQWRNNALTNPTPAQIWMTVKSATRVPGTVSCRVGGDRCRMYRGIIGLEWAQPESSERPNGTPPSTQYAKVAKPGDSPRHRRPAKPAELSVVFEDPCWGTRDGLIEAHANRSRTLERLHRWTH